MASKFQSRLVGTIVLVAVGVIILPDLLDGKKLHYKEEFASIPLKPEINADVESFEVLEPEEDISVLPEAPVQATVVKRQFKSQKWILSMYQRKRYQSATITLIVLGLFS